MASRYVVAVLHKDSGRVAAWAPGLEVEVEFIDNLCRRIQAKGVGLFRTEAHVLADVRAAAEDLLHEMKLQVPPA